MNLFVRLGGTTVGSPILTMMMTFIGYFVLTKAVSSLF